MVTPITPTGVERRFNDKEILVSRTDMSGRIIYCNQFFREVAGYTNKDLVGHQHNIVRHPHMPRSIFKILWEGLEAKREVFAYMQNLCSNGDHYWVMAHVTPTFNNDGSVTGYHSARRCPNRLVVEDVITPLYKELLTVEAQYYNRKQGLEASYKHLMDILDDKRMTYDQFVLSL